MEPLGVRAVRDWAGDHEIGKGRPYTEAAIVGPHRYDTRNELHAFVRGTRARPYRVTAVLDGGAVGLGVCTCPVGGGGKCKHVAAVLLAYAEDPDRFPDLEVREQRLGEAPAEELRELIDHLLNWAPELKPQLAIPMPGFVGGPVSADVFRRQALEVIRSARLNDDWTEEEVIEGLHPLAELRVNYQSRSGGTPRDAEAAEAVLAGVAAALREAGLATERMREVMGRMHLDVWWPPILERLFPDRPADPEPPF